MSVCVCLNVTVIGVFVCFVWMLLLICNSVCAGALSIVGEQCAMSNEQWAYMFIHSALHMVTYKYFGPNNTFKWFKT